ncbi:MAG: hypothetical protein WAX67_03680 [Rugosibacter sp.]
MYIEPESILARRTEAADRRRRIAYIPYEDMGNAYTERMRELLADFGSVERFAGVKALLVQLPRSLRRYDAMVVNWLENAIVAPATGRVSLRGTVRLFLKALLMKAFAKRMIFVRHNYHPHGTAAGSEALARCLVDLYEALFDVVITHSGADADRCYCPHPLYRQSAALPGAGSELQLPENYFLAFGRIVPYKKIDALVEAFPSWRALVVAGSVGDAAYAAHIARLRRRNFVFLPGRVDEAEAQRLVRSARGIVIANADSDVVVSGTFFYAISFGCPVYAVETPFLAWARQRLGDELLVLEPDLERLCRMIATAKPRPVSAASREAVVREFGDAAVSRALAAALELPR